MARSDRLPLLVAALVAALLVGLLLLAPDLLDRDPTMDMELVGAWMAFELEGAASARPGPILIEAGAHFRIHAVLEGRDDDGLPVYFTAAPALSVEGRPIAADRLREWSSELEARVLWFTVEGVVPHLVATSREALDRFDYQELYRPEWPRAWSIDGSIDPHHDDHLRRGLPVPEPRFGVQHFHLRVELYDPRQPLVPVQRFRSVGAPEVMAAEGEVVEVAAVLPEPLTVLSRVFGLTQVEVAAPEEEIGDRVGELTAAGLAFSWPRLLLDYLGGVSAATLGWQQTALDGDLLWGREVVAGDLLRVGDRVVVLFRDEGGEGVLDGGDICLDFARGAVVSPIDGVFSSVGFLEWAPHPGR